MQEGLTEKGDTFFTTLCLRRGRHTHTDSCGGDSGGPLTCQDPNTKSYYLAGVTSFGFSDCGKRGHLGIYARMKTFEHWVKATIERESAYEDEYEEYNGGFQYYGGYRSLGQMRMYG